MLKCRGFTVQVQHAEATVTSLRTALSLVYRQPREARMTRPCPFFRSNSIDLAQSGMINTRTA